MVFSLIIGRVPFRIYEKSELTSRSAPILFFQLLGLDVVVKTLLPNLLLKAFLRLFKDVCVVVD